MKPFVCLTSLVILAVFSPAVNAANLEDRLNDIAAKLEFQVERLENLENSGARGKWYCYLDEKGGLNIPAGLFYAHAPTKIEAIHKIIKECRDFYLKNRINNEEFRHKTPKICSTQNENILCEESTENLGR